MNNQLSITNDRGLEILIDTHRPPGDAKACVVIVHGFKGYKDYGFIPVMAHDLCEQDMLVHRINLSTSGMTNETETFARPDLFALDTWNRQVEDVQQVVRAIQTGTLDGAGLPLFLIGHSRGGATVLLAGGRHGASLELSGIITINAVDRCCRMSQVEQRAMLERGYTYTESARTGQTLRIDSNWLQEQLNEPDAHDVLLQASRCGVPICVMHGDNDDAVDIGAGEAITHKLNTPLFVLPGSNHVLNMPNPSDREAPRSLPFLKAIDEINRFIGQYSDSTVG